MIERKGDMWKVDADGFVVPTNGMVRPSTGEAAMGGGVALDAARLYPELLYLLGDRLVSHGNHTFRFEMPDRVIITFPTKDHWREPSPMDLVRQSAIELRAIADEYDHKLIVLPRVGCGLGGLDWGKVRPMLDEHLDDRFVAMTP